MRLFHITGLDGNTGAKRKVTMAAATEQEAINRCGFVVEHVVELPPQRGLSWIGVITFCIVAFIVGLGIGGGSKESRTSTSNNTASFYDQQEALYPRPQPTRPAVPARATEPQRPQYEITDVQTRITEQNDQWWKYAWVMKIRNDSQYPITLDAEIKWLDAEGFVVETHSAYDLTVPAMTEKTFQDFDLITMPAARNVRSVTAETSID